MTLLGAMSLALISSKKLLASCNFTPLQISWIKVIKITTFSCRRFFTIMFLSSQPANPGQETFFGAQPKQQECWKMAFQLPLYNCHHPLLVRLYSSPRDLSSSSFSFLSLVSLETHHPELQRNQPKIIRHYGCWSTSTSGCWSTSTSSSSSSLLQ